MNVQRSIQPDQVWPMDRRIALAGLFALAGLAILIGLGAWQLERKAWKEALIVTLTQRSAAVAVALPAPDDWRFLNPANDEFRRVVFRAEFVNSGDPHREEARVYTSGSALRDDIKTPGYFAFASARLPNSRIVVVNRGYVPDQQPTAATRQLGPIDGMVTLIGVMRWPETPSWFVGAYNASQNLWFARDHQAMAAQNGWGAVAPFYIELEAPAPPGGFPKPGRLKINLTNNHLQYALTWFGLAIVLAAVFSAWVWSRRPAAFADPR